MRLLKHGATAILVEKPGAMDLNAMRELAEADIGRRIRVAYNRRFLPSVQKANALIENDGGIQSLHFEFTELPDRIEALGAHPLEATIKRLNDLGAVALIPYQYC
jgi:predicted dehydrogenase